MPESLALVHIGNVHLDNGARARLQRVHDGYRGMGQGTWIDDDCDSVLMCLMDPIYDLEFCIPLAKTGGKAQL